MVTAVFVGLVAPLLPAAALGAPLPDASLEAAVASAPAHVWQRWEQVLTSARRYGNPYADVTLRVRYTGPGGRSLRAYGFWDGGDTFRIRCAFPIVGTWRWETECSNAADTGLHRQRGAVEVAPYQGGLAPHAVRCVSPRMAKADGCDYPPRFRRTQVTGQAGVL